MLKKLFENTKKVSMHSRKYSVISTTELHRKYSRTCRKNRLLNHLSFKIFNVSFVCAHAGVIDEAPDKNRLTNGDGSLRKSRWAASSLFRMWSKWPLRPALFKSPSKNTPNTRCIRICILIRSPNGVERAYV